MNPEMIETAVATYRLLDGIALLLGLVNSSLLIVLFFRRRPSLDTVIGELMTVKKCTEKHQEEGRKREGIYGQFRKGEDSFKGLERAIGRLEGKVESMEKTIQQKLTP